MVLAVARLHGEQGVQRDAASVEVGGRSFALDAVIGAGAGEEALYDAAARRPVEQALAAGAGWMCLCYGPRPEAGAELFRELDDDAGCGLAVRGVRQLFAAARAGGGSEWAISVSALHIYQEQVSDLLNPARRNLRVADSKAGGPYAKELSEVFVAGEQDAVDCLCAAASRSVSLQTDGYGHTLVAMTARQTRPDGTARSSKITFVQLGGSDLARAGKPEELSRTNKGLLALNAVVEELESGMSVDPSVFLRSSLTAILRDALGGSTAATVVINVPAELATEEAAAAALQFGERVRLVQNSSSRDEVKDAGELEAAIRGLGEEMESHRRYIHTLETQLSEAGSMAPNVASGRQLGAVRHDIDVRDRVAGRVQESTVAAWSAGRLDCFSPDAPVMLQAQSLVLQDDLEALNTRVAQARQRLAEEQEVAEDRRADLAMLTAQHEAEGLLVQWARGELKRLSAMPKAGQGTFDLLQVPTTAPAEDEEREDEALAEMQATVVELEADNAALEAELADAEARELRMRARLQLRSRRWPGLQLDETVPLPPPGDEPSQAAPEAAQPAAGAAEVDLLGFAAIPQGDAGSMFSGLEMLSDDAQPPPQVSATSADAGGGDLLQLQEQHAAEQQAALDAELAAVGVRAEQERQEAAAAAAEARKEEKRAKARAEAEARRARIEAKKQQREAALAVPAPPTVDLLGSPQPQPQAQPQAQPQPQTSFDLL